VGLGRTLQVLPARVGVTTGDPFLQGSELLGDEVPGPRVFARINEGTADVWAARQVVEVEPRPAPLASLQVSMDACTKLGCRWWLFRMHEFAPDGLPEGTQVLIAFVRVRTRLHRIAQALHQQRVLLLVQRGFQMVELSAHAITR
jgi:hypothetical protein